jgi:hypothetical protein
MKGGSQARIVNPAQKRSMDPAKSSCSVGVCDKRRSTSRSGASTAATEVGATVGVSPTSDDPAAASAAAASAAAAFAILGSGIAVAATPAATNANAPRTRESVRQPTCVGEKKRRV